MGKRLETPFADVNQRIIKRSRKDWIRHKKENVKRKSTSDLEGPLQKKAKVENKHKQNWCIKQQQEISNETVYTEQLSKTNNVLLKTREHVSYDLFFTDELTNNYLNFTCKDIYSHIIDEIALEGLDGITIEAFWKRFLMGLEGPLHMDQSIQNFIWQNVIVTNDQFQFYELPTERHELEIYNPFDYLHTEIGVVMELAYEIPDIYPFSLVQNALVLGSCATFNERLNISQEVNKLTIEEVEEIYGRKLVIVADQDLRTYALCGALVDPCIVFLNMEYCLLERIGRSRKFGELTQGNMSISTAFKIDAKTIFHYKKNLYNSDLISKQFFTIKSAIFDQNKTGSLLQLRRFYTNIRNRQRCLADQIINLLRNQPGFRLDSKKLRYIFSEQIAAVSKILKNGDFRKFVKPKIYPYTTIYPNATRFEYEGKHTKVEKSITCYELVNPYINVAAYWRVNDQEDSDAEDDKEEELCGHRMYNMDTLRDIYYHIYLKGDEGCSGKEIKKIIGLDKNSTRMALNKLLGKALIDFNKYDDGKQRKYMYKARCWKKPDSMPSTSTKTNIKLSSVKTKILERQKAALIKRKQETQNSLKETPPVKDTKPSTFLIVDTPHISDCKFLVAKHFVSIEPATPTLLKVHLSSTYSINLTYMFFGDENTFNINQILDQLKPSLRTVKVKSNFKNVCVKTHNYDQQTKFLLFRAALGEIKVNSKLFAKSEDENARRSVPNLTHKPSPKTVTECSKLNYMGPNPLLVYSEEERGVKTEMFVSTPPVQFKLEMKYPKDKTFTERVYDRMQIILDLLNEMEIIEEVHTLNRYIVKKEAQSGYDKKIDRKSLQRILKRLVEDGYVKIYKLILNNNTISKTLVFICHPVVTHMHDIIKTSCQQLKWKYFFSVAKKTIKPHLPTLQKKIEDKFASSPFSQTDVLNSIKEMKQLGQTMVKEIKRKFNKQIGKVYGVKPKFTRMRIMHEFLFFLVHESTGKERPLPTGEIEKLFKNFYIAVSENDLDELPKVYRNELSWRMFIPPLPVHTGWSKGWALICDIILRLPLCILLKIHNCNYEDPDLLAILNHPIKRYYLVKELPEKIRKTVLFKRKYLFAVYDTINRLVFCGLIQFGPQKYKEKDQVFVYLNRKASLLDTTSSGPGYNEIEKKEYPALSFYFHSHTDVEKYWQTLNRISINTKLNTREPGKLVTLVYINSKPELTECIKSRTAKDVEKYDNGLIPGDGKGASGLDSALWAHLVRNWFVSNGNVDNSLYNELQNTTIQRELSKQLVSFKELHVNSGKVFLATVPKEKMRNFKDYKKIIGSRSKKKGSVKWTIRQRNLKEKKREYSDAIDRKILKKLSGKRVTWSKEEEEIVYFCKIADILLNCDKASRKQVVPFNVVRDVVHKYSAESKFKTSRAIQRRLNRLQKSSYHAFDEVVSNLLKIKPIHNTFGLLVSKIGTRDPKTGKIFRLTERQMSSAFIILVSYILRNRNKVKDVLHGNALNIDHLSEENLKYTEENLVELDKKNKKYEDVKTEDDIRKDVVKSIIHSSLCSKDGKINLATQLLKIYVNYTDALLRDAVAELRESNTVTCKTWKNKKTKIWDTPFALSQYYVFFQYSTFNNVSALETYNTFLNLTCGRAKNFQSTESSVHNKRYGQLLGVNELYTICDHRIIFEFNLPQNTVTLNPRILNHEDLVNELAVRYQLKLKSLQHESHETEIDLEEDNDAFKAKNSHELDDEKQTSESADQTKIPPANSILQASPLDLTVDSGNSETIDRLKHWITDRVQTDIGRRSPSPDFLSRQSENIEGESGYKDHPTKSEDNVQEIPEFRRKSNIEKHVGQIPSLEEIKEGMLKVYTNNEERTIPYITELSDLLKENFHDLKTNADIVTLKTHFITEYITLDNIITDEFEDNENHYMIKYINDKLRNRKIWKKIENGIIIGDFNMMPNFQELIRNDGGDNDDVELAEEIIQYTSAKTFFGATGQELKANFLHREKNCSLASIIKNLTNSGVLFQTGICTLTFVHYSYQYIWVIEQDKQDTTSPHTPTNEESVQRQKSSSMKIMPWVRVNGTLNMFTLKIWITNMLSYCLDYPTVPFSKICEKFCYIKPVDLYFIVQILEEIGCIELLTYDVQEEDLFSEWTMPKERYATFLDDIKDIIVRPHNVSMTYLGSFFFEMSGDA